MAFTKAKRARRLRQIELNYQRAETRDWVESPEKHCRGCDQRFRLSRPRAALLECGHALYCFECYSQLLTRAHPKCPTCEHELALEPLTLHTFG
jgi:hypothetical protein